MLIVLFATCSFHHLFRNIENIVAEAGRHQMKLVQLPTITNIAF